MLSITKKNKQLKNRKLKLEEKTKTKKIEKKTQVFDDDDDVYVSFFFLIDRIDETLWTGLKISRRRRRETSIAVTTGTILDNVATNAAILGIDGRDAFLAPRFVELLQNGRVVGRAVMIHAERDVFDDLQATRTQLTFASSARAVACDAFLFGKELGCQIGCKVAAMFRFSNASLNKQTKKESLSSLKLFKIFKLNNEIKKNNEYLLMVSRDTSDSTSSLRSSWSTAVVGMCRMDGPPAPPDGPFNMWPSMFLASRLPGVCWDDEP